VWLGHKHIGPSTFFFLYFEFILKTNNINVDSTRKISSCKINGLKVERIQNSFENLNSSKMTLKMLKTMQIYQECIFLGFHYFCYFWFFSKIYQTLGQKLSSYTCPLFTMLSKQNFLNVLHSKLVKKKKNLPGLLSDPLIQELHFF